MNTHATKIRDLEFRVMDKCSADTLWRAIIPGFGIITVLDRQTGFSDCHRDVESGYRDEAGKFWLASGRFDIRDYPDLPAVEAAEQIKINANTCVGE